jgi:hypothetical protein
MQTSNDTLAIFIAESGPLISRRLDQLPVPLAAGVIFNFDNEYYQESLPPFVCVGRTAGGKKRDLNIMLFEALGMLYGLPEVVNLLRRKIISYTVPETGGSSIVQITNRIEEGCSDLVIVRCKRLQRQQQEGPANIAQMIAALSSDAPQPVAPGKDDSRVA